MQENYRKITKVLMFTLSPIFSRKPETTFLFLWPYKFLNKNLTSESLGHNFMCAYKWSCKT